MAVADSQSVRVGSINLCTACWKRDGHEPGCEHADDEFFFAPVELGAPYRNFIITGIEAPRAPESGEDP